MNENINLCELLKNLEGIKLYSTIFGYLILTDVGDKVIYTEDNYNILHVFSKNGLYLDRKDAECTLFPSKEQRNWYKFERPISKKTPMMCSYKSIPKSFCLRYYKEKIKNKHYCYSDEGKSECYNDIELWDIMIPFDKFNPNNIEESLKYNIQK